MSKNHQEYKPRSLAQHFEAPDDDFVGCFGWLCGYSADAGFLNDAIEQFARQTRAQRAYTGRVLLAVMLDAGNPQISPIDAPGVIHLPFKDGRKPWLLLHAKIALLGFRHVSDPQKWRLRLIVSTGNWTRETLEDSLDLVWRLDLSGEELTAAEEATAQTCADLKAAWSMLDWLRGHFDFRVIGAVPTGRNDTESLRASSLFEDWISRAITKSRAARARMFDNQKASLLAQIPGVVDAAGDAGARNYLGMGSGFFETSQNRDEIPSILSDIFDILQERGLLTRRPEVDVFVNPNACQAVAGAIKSFSEKGWSVREAGKPTYFKNSPRSLHAKFIFSANYRDNSDQCNGAWLYLGSGNLTGPGIANKMSPQIGNFEVGVILAPETLKWEAARGVPEEQVLTNVLPMQWETDFSQSSKGLAAGSDMPDREVQFIAPPIAWLLWRADGDAGWLAALEEASQSFVVLDEGGDPCLLDPANGYKWPNGRPRQVRIRWVVEKKQHEAAVPVLDEFGRIAATRLPAIDVDEAWGQLANFPMPPDDEDLPPDGEDLPPDIDDPLKKCDPPRARQALTKAVYPVREMMQFIENVAGKQVAVSQVDWSAWCARLEQCLAQVAGSPVLNAFIELKLNPLSPLWHLPFRPDFAATPEQNEGQRYEEVLRRIEKSWGVASLGKLGETR